ncbi:hypothetical protein F5Y03DRAFT_200273 [Xylaria venustula]|nr:hypothetical protein F5Y03DRAFT_200273 [Xylaria venustula]
MKLFVLLALPLAALAAPNTAISKHFSEAPFAPASPEQGGFDRCSSEEHHKGHMSHPANMLDCLEIGLWANNNNGAWILDQTSTRNDNSSDDDAGWHILRAEGNCALLVRNNAPTSVGNKDISDLIDAVHLGDGIELGPIEELGTFSGCQAGVNVSFWLRSP